MELGLLILLGIFFNGGFIVVLYLILKALASTKGVKEHQQKLEKAREVAASWKPYEPLDENRVPTRTESLIFILDGFTDAVGKFTPETEVASPVSELPAPRDIVENALIEVLVKLKDPAFRKQIKEGWPVKNHAYILKDDYPDLLSVNLEQNLPCFIDAEEADFMRKIARKHSECTKQGLSPEETLEEITLDTWDRFSSGLYTQAKESKRIAARLRSRGLSTVEDRIMRSSQFAP